MRTTKALGILFLTGLLAFSPEAFAGSDKNDVNDIGDRKVAHRSIISQEKEIAIGKQYATEIEKQAKIVKDPVVAEYVNRIAQNIARNSDLTIPLTVKVIDDPSINAFALPGGFLFVNTGVLLAADEESQLAGVIAHEVAHVAARHWASQMTKATILQYATIPLIFVPMTYPVYMGISSAMNFGIPMAFLKFSRNDEAEADFLGLQYMYKAGYDPNSYVSFFSKVINEERRQPGSAAKVFMDHPPTPDRIIKCEQEIKNILPKRQEYLVTTSEFNDVKARMKTLVALNRKTEKSGPTLRRRAPDESTSGSEGKGSSQDDEKPPVLRRRD
jgi:predicted Zn-dependent protease